MTTAAGATAAMPNIFPPTLPTTVEQLSEKDARELAVEAHVYCYPLVLVDVTKDILTAVPRVGFHPRKAPVNQFYHMRTYPDPTVTEVVRPNADTLYSMAFLDLQEEPIVLSLPDTHGRYYLMPLLDAWLNIIESPGTRTTGTAKAAFAITGPGWTGELPAGLPQIKSPTCLVWLIGRTGCKGKADYAAVHKLQGQYQLIPLSAWGRPYTPPDNVPFDPNVDMETSNYVQVERMDAREFYGRFCRSLKTNPPAPADTEGLKQFELLGIVPGKDFDIASLDPKIVRALEASLGTGLAKIAAAGKIGRGRKVNYWHVSTEGLANWGADYLRRAAVAFMGPGVSDCQDSIFPITFKDADGEPLSGEHRYVITFDRGKTPPANAFWSIAMYSPKGHFIDNPIERYSIGDRDDLAFNDDGSLDIYIQHASPGTERESNWLPAPAKEFNLTMRLYWPKEEIFTEQWNPPGVRRVA